MPEYPKLTRMLEIMGANTSEDLFTIDIIPYLTEIWIADYTSSVEDRDMVEVPLEGFSYLFDITPGRLIAAWGISRGRSRCLPASRSRISTR
jgi:hypothetical protein